MASSDVGVYYSEAAGAARRGGWLADCWLAARGSQLPEQEAGWASLAARAEGIWSGGGSMEHPEGLTGGWLN